MDLSIYTEVDNIDCLVTSIVSKILCPFPNVSELFWWPERDLNNFRQLVFIMLWLVRVSVKVHGL